MSASSDEAACEIDKKRRSGTVAPLPTLRTVARVTAALDARGTAQAAAAALAAVVEEKDEEQAAEWCSSRPDFDKFSKLMTVEEAAALLAGDGEDDAPRSNQRQLPGRSSASAPRGYGSGAAKKRTAQDDLGDDD